MIPMSLNPIKHMISICYKSKRNFSILSFLFKVNAALSLFETNNLSTTENQTMPWAIKGNFVTEVRIQYVDAKISILHVGNFGSTTRCRKSSDNHTKEET